MPKEILARIKTDSYSATITRSDGRVTFTCRVPGKQLLKHGLPASLLDEAREPPLRFQVFFGDRGLEPAPLDPSHRGVRSIKLAPFIAAWKTALEEVEETARAPADEEALRVRLRLELGRLLFRISPPARHAPGVGTLEINTYILDGKTWEVLGMTGPWRGPRAVTYRLRLPEFVGHPRGDVPGPKTMRASLLADLRLIPGRIFGGGGQRDPLSLIREAVNRHVMYRGGNRGLVVYLLAGPNAPDKWDLTGAAKNIRRRVRSDASEAHLSALLLDSISSFHGAVSPGNLARHFRLVCGRKLWERAPEERVTVTNELFRMMLLAEAWHLGSQPDLVLLGAEDPGLEPVRAALGEQLFHQLLGCLGGQVSASTKEGDSCRLSSEQRQLLEELLLLAAEHEDAIQELADVIWSAGAKEVADRCTYARRLREITWLHPEVQAELTRQLLRSLQDAHTGALQRQIHTLVGQELGRGAACSPFAPCYHHEVVHQVSRRLTVALKQGAPPSEHTLKGWFQGPTTVQGARIPLPVLDLAAERHIHSGADLNVARVFHGHSVEQSSARTGRSPEETKGLMFRDYVLAKRAEQKDLDTLLQAKGADLLEHLTRRSPGQENHARVQSLLAGKGGGAPRPYARLTLPERQELSRLVTERLALTGRQEIPSENLYLVAG